MNTFKHKKHIANKFDSFKNLIDTLGIPFQIIGLTETWLNENNLDCFSLKGYEYIGPNRPKKQAVVLAYMLQNNLSIKVELI